MADILIKHGYLVTMDPERQIYSDGAVAIEGSKIVDVGRTEDILARHQATETIDAGGNMILPGLIDGHNHPFNYLVGGFGDSIHLFERFVKYTNPYEIHLAEASVPLVMSSSGPAPARHLLQSIPAVVDANSAELSHAFGCTCLA